MKENMQLEIPSCLDGKRLDAALAALLPEQSRSFWQRMIEEGNVAEAGQLTNQLKDQTRDQVAEQANAILLKKAGTKVRTGQVLFVTIPQPEETDILAEEITLDILYEDSDLIVVNKPKGMVVHPAPGHASGTLVNALMYHCGDSLSGINGALRPGIVHRIDRDTTGVLVAAKNDRAHAALALQLKEHSITRRYRAIVHGNLRQDEGTVAAPIGRHPVDRKRMAVTERGREAVTHYTVLERLGQYTYIECRLETGRTHQIRVHMAHIGHPVLGDEVYGPKKCPYHLEGQTLHAMVLGFVHPVTGAYMEFSAPLPEYFAHLLQILS